MKYTKTIVNVLFLGLILTGQVFASDEEFIGRWKDYDEQLMVDDLTGYYRIKIELPFSSLKEYRESFEKPATIEKQIEKVFLLYSYQNFTILLATRRNIMKNLTNLNEEFRQTMKRCADDTSWIVVLPENRWTEINLNPYCTMDYGEEDIRIDLFWINRSAKPLMDIVTHAMTCVPHDLYGFDAQSGDYELIASKCTGRKTIEGYGGPNLEQLF